MLNTRLSAARRIARELFATHSAIDSATSTSARLLTAMVEGRADTRMHAMLGQKAFSEIAAASVAISEARARMAAAHQILADVRHDAGLDAYAMGDLDECPPPPKGVIRLRTVA